MRGERQMNKNSQRLEDGASGSPYDYFLLGTL